MALTKSCAFAARGRSDLVVAGIGARVGDVLGDARRQQHGLLPDDANWFRKSATRYA
jgi:hypothetical protein